MYLSVLARFLIGGGEWFWFCGLYGINNCCFKKFFKNFRKNEKIKLSCPLYSDKLLYFLKFGVKFGLYCVKYVGVVVCTGVLIKVSCRQNFFFIRACMRTGVCDNDYIILICIILHMEV